MVDSQPPALAGVLEDTHQAVTLIFARDNVGSDSSKVRERCFFLIVQLMSLFTTASANHYQRGLVMHRTVFASDIKRCSQAQAERHDITCFRCGENGHYKSECLNWKTKLCWHHVSAHATCTKQVCPFAHGPAELRAPWQLKCVRIVKCPCGFVDLGCKSTKHTYRNCPYLDSGTGRPAMSTA